MVSPQEHMCYQDLCVCVGKRHFMYALSDLSKNCTKTEYSGLFHGFLLNANPAVSVPLTCPVPAQG